MSKLKKYSLIFIGIIGFGAYPSDVFADEIYPALELQGHRGARGLAPENSLPAFHQAYLHGMTTIELDSTLTADHRLIIYHDTEINTQLCRHESGELLKTKPIMRLNVSDLKNLDCGSIKQTRFPQQKLEKVSPPLLEEVLSLEKVWGYHPLYNLEIKVDSKHNLETKKRAVIALVNELKSILKTFPSFKKRLTIQSFDLEVLGLVHEYAPQLRRSALFEPYFGSFKNKPRLDMASGLAIIKTAKNLGVAVISPYEKWVTKDFMKHAHQANLKVIPWTVNDAASMIRLIHLGVDGLISDYPDRLSKVVANLGATYECRTRHADIQCKKEIKRFSQRRSLSPLIDLSNVDSSIVIDIRYATKHNFMGRKTKGYHTSRCLLTRPAAEALSRVQRTLQKNGQSLKIFDCYRPQRAVDDFVSWAQDLKNQQMKAVYYPNVNKARLFKDGYIAERSGHSRGSTVDLTIQDLQMGTPWDFFDVKSHTNNQDISQQAQENRMYLLKVMEAHGYQNYDKEWWHYTLKSEPFQNHYFDQVVQ
jgi:zinc D-Ala-D-Ala dipeptidase